MKKFTILNAIFACILLTTACGNMGEKKDPAMETAKQNKEKFKSFYDAINAGKYEAFDSLLTVDAVEHTPDPAFKSDKKGREYLKEVVKGYRESFPDLKFEILHLIADGDLVCGHYKLTGTNTGPMGPMPPTGKKIDVGGMDLILLKNGMMTEHWGYLDMQAFMMQLGMMPSPEEEAAMMDEKGDKAKGHDHK